MDRLSFAPAGRPNARRILLLAAPWVLAFLLPLAADDVTTGNLAYCLVWAFTALGLALMWGHGGILSFGQTAFFGISGYTYGIVTLNYGEAWTSSWGGLLVGLAASIVVAFLLGYMIFYGKIRGVFIGILTLSVTLVLETFMAQTAGPQWAVGEARLNGFNGMSGMPPLAVPWPGDPIFIEGNAFYYLVLAMLAIAYVLSRRMLHSPFGLSLAAIRENPQRAEMLGIDIRKHQMLVFVAGCGLAGLSGALYTIWGSYITPSSMGLTAAAMPVIWVATAGRKSLGGVIVGTAILVWLSQSLAIYGSQYALILMGAILLFVVLAAPEGLLPGVLKHARRLGALAGRKPAPAPGTGQGRQS